MKHGKRPTRRQLKAIEEAKLSPGDWLVIKSVYSELHLVHRISGKQRIITVS